MTGIFVFFALVHEGDEEITWLPVINKLLANMTSKRFSRKKQKAFDWKMQTKKAFVSQIRGKRRHLPLTSFYADQSKSVSQLAIPKQSVDNYNLNSPKSYYNYFHREKFVKSRIWLNPAGENSDYFRELLLTQSNQGRFRRPRFQLKRIFSHHRLRKEVSPGGNPQWQ